MIASNPNKKMYVIAAILIISVAVTESLSGFSFIKPEAVAKEIAAITSGNKSQINDLVIVIPSESKIRKKAAQPDTTKKPTKNDAMQEDDKFVTPAFFEGATNSSEHNQIFNKFIRQNTVYPKELYNSGTRGKVFINYSVDEKGKVYNVSCGNEGMKEFYKKQMEDKEHPENKEKYEARLSEVLDNPLLVSEAIRLVESFPKHTPALNKEGRAVKCKTNICSIAFNDPKSRTSNDLFREYIKYNLKYPEEAKNKKIEGTVYLKFDLDKDNRYGNIKVYDMRPFLKEKGDTIRVKQYSENPLLVAEAVRLLKERPGYYIEKFDTTTRASFGMCNIDFFLPK